MIEFIEEITILKIELLYNFTLKFVYFDKRTVN